MDGLPVTGINQQTESAEAICVYPNPSSGKFRIEFEGILKADFLAIYNLSGETIFSCGLTQQKSVDIDLSRAPKGFYFVKVHAGREIYNRKFVVE